ncbi:MAG TPA: hydrogenase subunit [Deltaproteobacteria bacterium]|nr:MAG: hypothetical protein A2Z79_00575 [Deltaproteobacteria bacterium GWA2_55_82]OGQ64874.1 MAG: hypothetical protein A3I81_04680 [Deltaproteobacteria bacterium RIFCSPLOWO2_02_FULL_55_12]OIJ73941.1 MAG: hypothetical protein A2V21_306480 [Deltaproteobacteria bacterium GWC2_55_46]HBG46536.1 hydrogenase subunit [Deltaproteobacteria bacterium]HCY09938.1 hydrogenase subunit [Deltaproteobacteria bacterium]
MSEKRDSLLKFLLSKGSSEMDGTARGAVCCKVKRDLFAQSAKVLKEAGVRLVAEWASDESFFDRGFALYAAYSAGEEYLLIKTELANDSPYFPSLTKYFPAAHRFERQIHSLMGLIPFDHPDLRPWIKHEHWPEDAYPLRKSFDGKKPMAKAQGEYRWVTAEGEGVFEIPVGPVHAGIIEPGHFRFQAVGEGIINLETRLGYAHKGIEKRFESLPWHEAVRLAGRVSGDSTVAHAVAFCMAAEEASGCVLPAKARYIRAIMMERERVANHLGDIGAICNDTGFAFLHNQFSILREKVLRTNRVVFGHRLMMDRVTLGGVATDIGAQDVALFSDEIRTLKDEFDRLARIYDDNPTVQDRVYGTGVLEPEVAKYLGVVGFVARASGQPLDVRIQGQFPPYDKHLPKANILTSGDVHARAWIRIEEVRDSFRLLKEMIGALPDGPLSAEWTRPLPEVSGFSAVEGWRGEVVYWVQCGLDRNINRCMVRDPSSVNWLAIEQAIRGGNIVPDFPLCNKSFNQSYSGHDL